MNINPEEVVKKEIISNIENPDKQIQQVGIDLTIAEEVNLGPKEFVNVQVNECFNMVDCFGIINIRSSFSRKGIFSTSGIYDPGFNGTGGVSIYNLSGKQITIKKGTRIGQMVCFKANFANQYNGHYNQSNSIESKGGQDES